MPDVAIGCIVFSDTPSFRRTDCAAIVKSPTNIVMPVKTGIQDMLKILDSPVLSTGRLKVALCSHGTCDLKGYDKKNYERSLAGGNPGF